MKKFSFIDTIIEVFETVDFQPMELTVPYNGDVIKLTPTFMDGIKDTTHMNGLIVEGAPLPLEGTITYVVSQLRDYDKMVATRNSIDKVFVPAAVNA